MKIRYPFKNEQPTTDNLVISVVDGDGVAISGATVSVEEKAETGTVTVTCKDESENLLSNAMVVLLTENAEPSPTNVVGVGITGEDGTTLLYEFDEQGRPTQTVAEIPYGTYYLISNKSPLLYGNTLVIDGDENVTITLTVPTYDGTVEVGYMNDSVWTPIPNATVEIGDVGSFETPLFTGTTDSNGVANFNMPYFDYYVRVTATGYTQDDEEYWAFDGTQPTSSIVLTRDGD